jgi:hypothetical protein
VELVASFNRIFGAQEPDVQEIAGDVAQQSTTVDEEVCRHVFIFFGDPIIAPRCDSTPAKHNTF